MELVKVNASHRQAAGKGTARRLRGAGKIPAIAYSKGEPALNLAISPKDLIGVLARELGRNSVIQLDVDGGDPITVLVRDYQYHPLTRVLLHVDFLKISLDQPVDVDVPLDLTGKAKGVIEGGILRQVYRRVPLRCLPANIPAKIVHDVSELEIDDHVKVGELALPEGVTARLPPEQTVAAVGTEKKKGLEEEEAAAAAAAALTAGAVPGAPGAPGAEAAAAPAPEGKPGRERDSKKD
jgi:large subunit ribosomal protein L25